MAITVLIFDYKKQEQNFFKNNKFDYYDLHFFEESLNEITVNNLPEDLLEETTVVSVYLTSKVTDKVLKKFPDLRILSTRSSGYEHIDIQECCNKKVKVLNAENYDNKAVVQFTFCIMTMLVRKILNVIHNLKEFNYGYDTYTGQELNSLTLGVIGTGNVGKEICRIANAFGMNILALDIKKNNKIIEKYGVKYTDKTTLLENSDVISLHVPLTEQTREMITKREFSIMKPSAIILNTSSGELINTSDLYDAIIKGSIAGAGLDTMECEEITFDTQNITAKIKEYSPECIYNLFFMQRLARLDNVIVTPKISYGTQESVNKTLKTMFEAIEDCIQGGHTNQVN